MHVAATAARSFFLSFVVTATAIGISGPMLVHSDNHDNAVTLFGYTNEYNSHVKVGDIVCNDIRYRMKGSAGTAIVAVVFQAIALLFSFYDIFAGPNMIFFSAISGLHVLSLLFGLVAWAYALSMRDIKQCGTEWKAVNNGFHIGYGLALLIAAWCVQLFLVTATHFATMSMPAGSSSSANEPTKEVATTEQTRDVADAEMQPVQYVEAPAEQQEQAPAAEEQQHYEQAPAEEQQQYAQEPQQYEQAPAEQQYAQEQQYEQAPQE